MSFAVAARMQGGVETLIAGACFICCCTVVSFSLFVSNLVIDNQLTPEQTGICGYLPKYLWTEAWLWIILLLASIALVVFVLTHGTSVHGTSTASLRSSSSGGGCLAGCHTGLVMLAAPFVMAALCWLHIGFGVGTGVWIGSNSEQVMLCRMSTPAVYRLTVANIVLSMIFLVLPAAAASYFSMVNVPRVLEFCRRDNGFTPVDASDPDADTDIPDDGDVFDLNQHNHMNQHAMDIPQTPELHAASAHGHEHEHEHEHEQPQTPDMRSTAVMGGAAFDGAGVHGGSDGVAHHLAGEYPAAAGDSGYGPALVSISPDELALGLGPGRTPATGYGGISGVTSGNGTPVLGPAAGGGGGYQQNDSVSGTPVLAPSAVDHPHDSMPDAEPLSGSALSMNPHQPRL